jgi:threonylcarbamoyladenosine tRNA methylthiotransferase MtaB
MRIAFYTLGCKTNQYETQAMERLLAEQGHEIGSFDEECDCYVINTCSVTAVADKKNRAVLRRCRREHPDAVIGVCGCYSQHAAQQVKELGADVVGGSGERVQFLRDLLAGAEKHEYVEHLDNALRRREFEVLPAGGLLERTRAMLKVQDGCTNFCTYCIIPYTRGPIRSEPLPLAVEQAKKLRESGYREIVVTGIEIAGWGRDLPGKPPIWQLIAAICEAVPELRIRLGSLEPRIVTEEFCQALSKYANLCPQFHLSMQSGCDSVLDRMKRRYHTAEYAESLARLRQFFPGCAITTDMIVGFPGETEEEFRQSMEFIRSCHFADMHIFPYSRRPGTPAADMPGQLGNAVKEARSRAAIEAAREMSEDYRRDLIGSRQEVLVEGMEGEYSVGHAPNYVKVYLRGEYPRNEIQNAAVTALYQDGVTAERN